MLEPIQGETGVIIATDTFMRELRELTHKRDLLLFVDEIQTGVGRTYGATNIPESSRTS